MAFLTSLQGIDAYAKTSKELKTKTVTGAIGKVKLDIFPLPIVIVTICSIIFAAVLLVMEVRDYFQIIPLHSVSVDSGNNGELVINFSINFPESPCSSKYF